MQCIVSIHFGMTRMLTAMMIRMTWEQKTQTAEREPLVNRIGVEYDSRYLVTEDSASRQISVQHRMTRMLTAMMIRLPGFLILGLLEMLTHPENDFTSGFHRCSFMYPYFM